MLCGMLVDFSMIIYFENERLVNQLSCMVLVPCEWVVGRLVILVWTSYPGMELVPCEWVAGGPVILVWN